LNATITWRTKWALESEKLCRCGTLLASTALSIKLRNYKVQTSNLLYPTERNRCEKRSLIERQNANGLTSESTSLTACCIAQSLCGYLYNSWPVYLQINYRKWLACTRSKRN